MFPINFLNLNIFGQQFNIFKNWFEMKIMLKLREIFHPYIRDIWIERWVVFNSFRVFLRLLFEGRNPYSTVRAFLGRLFAVIIEFDFRPNPAPP